MSTGPCGKIIKVDSLKEILHTVVAHAALADLVLVAALNGLELVVVITLYFCGPTLPTIVVAKLLAELVLNVCLSIARTSCGTSQMWGKVLICEHTVPSFISVSVFSVQLLLNCDVAVPCRQLAQLLQPAANLLFNEAPDLQI